MWEDNIEWIQPDSEAAPCWFVTNAGVEDQTVSPKFVYRSLATLRLHLKNTRIATSRRIKTEYDRRKQANQDATKVLMGNVEMWARVGGPSVEQLINPSDDSLASAHKAKELLLKIRSEECTTSIIAPIIDDTVCAVNALSSLDFERIRVEKFPLTPETLFEGFVHNMKDLHNENKLEAEDLRRRSWLRSCGEDIRHDGVIVNASNTDGDRFGCDPDKYSQQTSNCKPRGFNDAVLKASLVHIDEMRTLLEMHYDDLHMAHYIRRTQACISEKRTARKRRKSDYKVFRSVVNAHKRKLCQRIELPDKVSCVMCM